MTKDPKEGRTYAIIDYSTPLSGANLTTAKSQGVIQTSLGSIRKSLDGKKAIIKWRGNTPALLSAKILWSGTHAEMLAKIAKDTADWGTYTPPIPKQSDRRVIMSVEQGPTLWPWVALAAAIGCALAYWLV